MAEAVVLDVFLAVLKAVAQTVTEGLHETRPLLPGAAVSLTVAMEVDDDLRRDRET